MTSTTSSNRILRWDGNPETYESTFWSRVNKTDQCWEWIAAREKKGYGVVWKDGGLHKAHRIAYQFMIGPIPDGLLVLHICDNPPCVRPDHLFIGTYGDNNRDMTKKDRHGVAKLTQEQVQTIRAEYIAGKSISSLTTEYPVTYQTIWKKVRGLRETIGQIPLEAA